MVAEKFIDTTDGLTTTTLNSESTVEKKKTTRLFLTDDIIEEVMAKEDDLNINNENEEGKVVALQIVTHSAAIDLFTTSITWVDENGVSANDVLML